MIAYSTESFKEVLKLINAFNFELLEWIEKVKFLKDKNELRNFNEKLENMHHDLCIYTDSFFAWSCDKIAKNQRKQVSFLVSELNRACYNIKKAKELIAQKEIEYLR